MGQSTLGGILGIADATSDELHGVLDWLTARQARVERSLARRHLADGSLVLYDLDQGPARLVPQDLVWPELAIKPPQAAFLTAG